ncbi:50S ribosomal protein L25 [Clostridium thailandense]|uniref:50S ribosomal protein L25 n=1 Tax=Clostridium thailandense TaxID=2794346 RepID=UPI0039891982
MENLKLHKRQNRTSNEAKKGRRSGLIPGILYGKNINNMMFEISELELNKEISRSGEHAVLNIDLDGDNHRTIVKELQRDPVHHKIVHIDLEELAKNSTVQTELPIAFTGEDMVMKKGGAVQKEKSNVKVECKTEKIPRCINVDLSKLEIGETCRVMDLEVSEDITFIEDLNSIIATITLNSKPSDIPDED